MSLVYENLKLHITNEQFIIEALDNRSYEDLIIDRISGDLTLQRNDKHQIPPTVQESKIIYGIFGIINLVAGPYLIVITNRERVGDLMGHTIWKVTETELYSFQRSTMHLNQTQAADNRMYLSLLEQALNTPSYYYSTTFDLTHSMQRLANIDKDFHDEPLYARADNRFIWNGHVLQEFMDRPQLEKFILPVMHGFIEIFSSFVNGRTFDIALISRRSGLRAGTRYFVRGIDAHGDVANYVETEQIVYFGRHVCSLVQTRGSIPLHWSQRPNLKYKPKPKLSENLEEHKASIQKHFDSQVIMYGKQVVINLIDHKGSELVLEKALSHNIQSLNRKDVTYHAFDFHKECSKMRWHRLQILMDAIALDQEEFAYFMQDKSGKVVMQQNGVFRTNCIDCLDRTNVVQSMIARRALNQQLMQLGILSAGEKITDHKDLERSLKNMWADNADACSKQYAGTGALKTDFTRTGKRTKLGLLMDGWNSCIRYVKNNFADGRRQDSIDLLLGNYVVKSASMSPFSTGREWRNTLVPLVLLLAISMMFISLIIPATTFREQFLYVLFWGVLTITTAVYVVKHGVEFVNQPKLFQTKQKNE